MTKRPGGDHWDCGLDVGLPGVTRMDMHCHSWASDKPVVAALGMIDCPECFSPPEKVYEQARARGMDLVTITDHDAIRGAMELVDRGFEGVVVGEEVTVYFPEDHCKLHVLVWGLTPDQHEEIGSLRLREDVYEFANWLRMRGLAHSLAHPLYVQNGRMSAWHLERCTLLFRAFELVNGAHSGTHSDALHRYLGGLTQTRLRELADRHGIEPVWPRAWSKSVTAGSDDHGLLNLGRTWAAVQRDDGKKISDGAEFLRRVMNGEGSVGGCAGRSDLLAHQLTAVGLRWYADNLHDRGKPRQKVLASKLAKFAGVDLPRPGKVALIWDTLKRKALRADSSLPLVDALRSELKPLLERYPDLSGLLDSSKWPTAEGPAIAQHARMAEFSDDLSEALGRAMASGAVKSLRERDKSGMVDHLISYGIVQASRIPYIVSLFHQNKERQMLEKIQHESSAPGSGASPLERPMRVSLFTDTLGDVNGVCRFIQNVAEQANKTGRDLRVVTSTTFKTPDWANIHNFAPAFSTKMPRYEQLEIVLPPLMRILRHVDEHQPDVIHISTPGPVGMIGYLAAKMLRVPVLGVYHTDFPAYVDHLFDDHALTKTAETYMRFFYKPFTAIFTRSTDYVDSLAELGLQRDRIVALLPGLDTDTFHTRYRDPGLWARFPGVSTTSVKCLYVGRVSVEKNLPALTRVWKRVSEAAQRKGLNTELIVVGDGPYRKQMQEELAGCRAHFLGFRHGAELSAIYASSEFFAFPSTTDTLGQVVMESQASGLPVIVTDQGGPKEVVDHELTGFVLAADDADGWERSMMALIEDGDRRKRMGRAAHTRMARYSIQASFEHFWKAHVDAWHDHLATLGIRRPDDEERSQDSNNPSPSPAQA